MRETSFTVCQTSRKNLELGSGENVGKRVVNQTPQGWELGSALH